MSADNQITIHGNMTRDAELRYTPNGVAVANLGVAVNYRRKNGDEYEDVPSFFEVTAWQSLAENVSESLGKGDRVMVSGRMEMQSWETDEGDKRSKMVLIADEIGPSLRWATAEITKNPKENNGRQARSQRQPASSGARSSRPLARPEPDYDPDSEPPF